MADFRQSKGFYSHLEKVQKNEDETEVTKKIFNKIKKKHTILITHLEVVFSLQVI
jgi:hypothetical protein